MRPVDGAWRPHTRRDVAESISLSTRGRVIFRMMRPGEELERLLYQIERSFRICDGYGFLARLLLFVPNVTAPIFGSSSARLPPET
jgi:hypothetical protein